MDVKSAWSRGRLGQPLPDDRRFVRAVIVQDEMNVQAGWYLSLDPIQEFAKLHRAMAAMQLRSSAANKRGSSVAFVVVGAPFQLPRLQRQQRLCSVERLNLALLVDTK